MPNTVVNPKVTQLLKLQNSEKETLEARWHSQDYYTLPILSEP